MRGVRRHTAVLVLGYLLLALGVAACGDSSNCSDNLANGMGDLGLEVPEEPSSFNLFMNIPWTEDGRLTLEAPVTKPGDYVVFRAETDVVVAFSACPQDILPINGRTRHPTEAHFQVQAAP
jgi:uncharacterized protein YcgI (DUF1989 family)